MFPPLLIDRFSISSLFFTFAAISILTLIIIPVIVHPNILLHNHRPTVNNTHLFRKGTFHPAKTKSTHRRLDNEKVNNITAVIDLALQARSAVKTRFTLDIMFIYARALRRKNRTVTAVLSLQLT
jgi:hypothetical protein